MLDALQITQFDQIQLILIYQGSRDGFSFEQFHQYCNNQKDPLLIINKVDDQKKSIVGAFTTKSFKNVEGFYPDPKSFLFSLSKEIKIKTNSYFGGIYNKPIGQECGYRFGGFGKALFYMGENQNIYLEDEMQGQSFMFERPPNQELLDEISKTNFYVEETEVFIVLIKEYQI